MKESHPSSPAIRNFLPASILLLILGGGGLYTVLAFTSPDGGTRWLFFFFAILGLTGIALPISAFFNRRFPSTPPPSAGVILRQSIWFGIYWPFIAWLRIGRVLTPAMALLLALGFILIEWLLRLRERSQWKPDR